MRRSKSLIVLTLVAAGLLGFELWLLLRDRDDRTMCERESGRITELLVARLPGRWKADGEWSRRLRSQGWPNGLTGDDQISFACDQEAQSAVPPALRDVAAGRAIVLQGLLTFRGIQQPFIVFLDRRSPVVVHQTPVKGLSPPSVGLFRIDGLLLLKDSRQSLWIDALPFEAEPLVLEALFVREVDGAPR